MEITKYKIYWAHLQEHTDFMTQGYIGITKQTLAQRKRLHYYKANNGSDIFFHEMLIEHGDKVIWDVIGFTFTSTSALTIERSLRNNYKLTWNSTQGGGGYPIVTDETRKKQSIAQKGKKKSEAHRLKVSGENNPMFGKTFSDDRKKLYSKMFSGENNPMFGRNHTIETREKMSLKRVNYKTSDETKKLQSKSHIKYPIELYLDLKQNILKIKDISVKYNVKTKVLYDIRLRIKNNGYPFLENLK